MIRISISKDQIASLETEVFSGSIHIINTLSEARSAIRYLRKFTRIGFDTETRPSFRKGCTHKVSLLQLSTLDDCFLFRLNKLGMCNEIKDFLEDESIMKIGLSIKDDFGVLKKLADINPGGFVDLQDMVHSYHIVDASLQKIYAILFDKRVSKGQRLSNWENEELSNAQAMYAAIDAYACLRIYDYLTNDNFRADGSKYILKPEEINEKV